MKSRNRQTSISGLAPSYFLSGRVGSSIFTGIALLLLILTLIRPQAMSDMRVVTTDIVAPVLSVFTQPFQSLAETIGGISGMASLRAENAQLKSENVRLKEWYQTALMLQAENQSLQQLLNLKVETVHKYTTTRIISDAGNAFVKTVLISSGKSEGVDKNQAVLAGEGMIGRVIEAGQNSSRVLLLTDINSRVPVLIEGSSQKAVMAGNNSAFLALKHLPEDAGMVEGARVVTSGHGGVFPSGLPIGRLVKKDNGRFFVQPYVDMNKVTYVRVLSKAVKNNLSHNNLEKLLP